MGNGVFAFLFKLSTGYKIFKNISVFFYDGILFEFSPW